MTVGVDHDGLARAAARLRTDGTSLDERAATAPLGTDAGLASSLLGAAMSALLDASAHLTYETEHLADLADACNEDYQASDARSRTAIDELAGR